MTKAVRNGFSIWNKNDSDYQMKLKFKKIVKVYRHLKRKQKIFIP